MRDKPDKQTCQTAVHAASCFCMHPSLSLLILTSVMHDAIQWLCQKLALLVKASGASHQPQEAHPLEGLDSRGLIAHAASEAGDPTTGYEAAHRTRSCHDDCYFLWSKVVSINVEVAQRRTNDKNCKAGRHNSSPAAGAWRHLYNQSINIFYVMASFFVAAVVSISHFYFFNNVCELGSGPSFRYVHVQ